MHNHLVEPGVEGQKVTSHGTPTRGVIPPRTREGEFVARDGKRIPKATTIGNCATEGPREFASTRKGNYTMG
jgi:hypothetical protein